jgi:hypothetical protein
LSTINARFTAHKRYQVHNPDNFLQKQNKNGDPEIAVLGHLNYPLSCPDAVRRPINQASAQGKKV